MWRAARGISPSPPPPSPHAANSVANALNLGASLGYNVVSLSAFRPPETIGVSGLPPIRLPVWGESEAMYCWLPELAGFFSPLRGAPIMYATRDFLVHVLKSRGFGVTTAYSEEEGIVYTVTALSGV